MREEGAKGEGGGCKGMREEGSKSVWRIFWCFSSPFPLHPPPSSLCPPSSLYLLPHPFASPLLFLFTLIPLHPPPSSLCTLLPHPFAPSSLIPLHPPPSSLCTLLPHPFAPSSLIPLHPPPSSLCTLLPHPFATSTLVHLC